MRACYFFCGLAVVLTLLFCANCAAQEPVEIYLYQPQYPQADSAQNVTVMDTEDGIIISGDEVALLFVPPSEHIFFVDLIPDDAEITYTVQNILRDKSSEICYLQVLMDLGHESLVPAQIPIQGRPLINRTLYRPFPDALGSRNVTVAIDDEIGATQFAGLTFHNTAVFNVWKNGVVEVDREGIEAYTTDGTVWISQAISAEPIVGIVMVRK